MALNGARTIDACGEDERGVALTAHLDVERKTLVRKPMRRIGLNELVVEEDGLVILSNTVGIRDVWGFTKFGDHVLGKVNAISEIVGVYLFQLVHN